MCKSLVICIFAVLITGCTGMTSTMKSTTQNNPKETQSNLETERSLIYETLIREMFITDKIKLIVIRDHTALDDTDNDKLNRRFQRITKQISALSQTTLTDLQAKNEQSHILSKSFRLPVEYKLISEEEINEIFQRGGSWNEFYTKYPDSQGIMTLSEIGSNDEMNQALVYVGNQGSWKGGAGFYVFLIKENNAWAIKDKYTSWVS